MDLQVSFSSPTPPIVNLLHTKTLLPNKECKTLIPQCQNRIPQIVVDWQQGNQGPMQMSLDFKFNLFIPFICQCCCPIRFHCLITVITQFPNSHYSHFFSRTTPPNSCESNNPFSWSKTTKCTNSPFHPKVLSHKCCS